MYGKITKDAADQFQDTLRGAVDREVLMTFLSSDTMSKLVARLLLDQHGADVDSSADFRLYRFGRGFAEYCFQETSILHLRLQH